MFCFLTYDTYTYTKSDIQLYQEAIYKMKNAIKKRTIFLRHMLNVFLTSVCIFIQCFYVLPALKYYIIVKLREREGHRVDQEVTQRSFIDYRLSIIDIDFPDALH